MTVDGRPFFPRVIERRDESLEWLQKLGFNVIKLASLPTEAELAEAERLGLWLMAPPPVGSGTPRTTLTHARVLAWTLGEGLTRGESAAMRELARAVRSDGLSSGRLLA